MADNIKALVEQVKAAQADQTPLKIVGGGSKEGVLARKIEGDPLNVSTHDGIVSYESTELVITVRAGTLLREIEDTLDQSGQMLSFEPPYFGENATIGGTLACNLSGSARPWGGSIRDMVLGVQLINGRGEHLRFGGQVMKNVAGYDVARLQAGALGSLGVITEVSLKILPKPEKTLSFSFEMDQASATTQMNAFAGTPKPISAAAWLDGVFYVRLSGAQNAVDSTFMEWGGDLLPEDSSFWHNMREQKLDFFQGDSPLWRFGLRSTAPPLPKGQNDMLVEWGGGQRWMRGDHALEAMQMLAEDNGGHVTLFKGGDRTTEVRHGLSDAQKKVHIGLKNAFDPHKILNPGSLYSWM